MSGLTSPLIRHESHTERLHRGVYKGSEYIISQGKAWLILYNSPICHIWHEFVKAGLCLTAHRHNGWFRGMLNKGWCDTIVILKLSYNNLIFYLSVIVVWFVGRKHACNIGIGGTSLALPTDMWHKELKQQNVFFGHIY